jgi:hypothetical protein
MNPRESESVGPLVAMATKMAAEYNEDGFKLGGRESITSLEGPMKTDLK